MLALLARTTTVPTLALASLTLLLTVAPTASAQTTDHDAGMREALVFPPPEAEDADGLVDHLEAATDLDLVWVLGLSNRSHLVGTIVDETTLRFNVTAPDRPTDTWLQPTVPMKGIPHNTYLEPQHLVPGAVLHHPDPHRPSLTTLPTHTGLSEGNLNDRGKPSLDLVMAPGSVSLQGDNATERAADLASQLGIPATDPGDWSEASASSVLLYRRDETCTAYGCLSGRRTFLRCNCTTLVAREEPQGLPEGVEGGDRHSWLNRAEVHVSPDEEVLALRSGPWITGERLDLPKREDRANETEQALDARNVTFEGLRGPQLVLVHPSPNRALPTATYAWEIVDGQGGRSQEADRAHSARGGFYPASSLQHAATGETLGLRYDYRHIADPGYDRGRVHPVRNVGGSTTDDLLQEASDVEVAIGGRFDGVWRIPRVEIPVDEPVATPVRIGTTNASEPDAFLQHEFETRIRYSLPAHCCPEERHNGTRTIGTKLWLGEDVTGPVHLAENWTARFRFDGRYEAPLRVIEGEGEVRPDRLTWRSRAPEHLDIRFAEGTTDNHLEVEMPIWFNVTVDVTLRDASTGERYETENATRLSLHDPASPVVHRFKADNDAPYAVFSSPAQNATVDGEVSIRVDARDVGETPTVDLTVARLGEDGPREVADLIEEEVRGGWRATWNATDAEPGRYRIEAQVDDGQRTSRANQTVVVADRQRPPVARLLAPGENATVAGDVEIRAKAGDGEPPSPDVQLTVLGGPQEDPRRVTVNPHLEQLQSDTWQATWDASEAEPGRYRIHLRVDEGPRTSVDERAVVVVEERPGDAVPGVRVVGTLLALASARFMIHGGPPRE